MDEAQSDVESMAEPRNQHTGFSIYSNYDDLVSGFLQDFDGVIGSPIPAEESENEQVRDVLAKRGEHLAQFGQASDLRQLMPKELDTTRSCTDSDSDIDVVDSEIQLKFYESRPLSPIAGRYKARKRHRHVATDLVDTDQYSVSNVNMLTFNPAYLGERDN
eukprot:CAMPEP_0198722780 /NCGR_PEP_ID=MMETSP1475-20131203/403_1 /TAXON_ID= ORGANISM="Unidentified sp., Strain CCMP1999" /NCGR_SAMPLE_ID=MMETSP1475 /ASSEMBLY_ACC=CAM_ASM_001111 /LENGTH=160 /DNA_ID=CAMNT_0044483703 /DNA_START=195 /DNA_END=677 /DNA_ORIENTATION=+